MLLLVSFALFPPFAFIINVAALPVEYYLLDTSLKRRQIVSSLNKGEFPSK
jgi:hypothetical protein